LESITQIGTIFNTHGLKGEVKVSPMTSHPEIFKELDQVFLIKDNIKKRFSLAKCRHANNHWLFTFKEIEGINEAEGYKNFGIYVEDEKLLPLAEDEFFIHDLMDSKVYSTDDEYLGKVTDYFESGEQGVCTVTFEGESFLFPVTKEVLKDIDVSKKRITIVLLPGMKELNQ